MNTFTLIEEKTKNKLPYLILKQREESTCPFCGSRHITTNNLLTRDFNDIDSKGNPRYIQIHTRRYKCKECGKLWTPISKDFNTSFTPAFKKQVINDYYNNDKSIAQIAQELQVNHQNIRKIIRDKEAEYKLNHRYIIPELLAIEPVFFNRGNEKFYILTDPKRLTVLDIISEDKLRNLDLSQVKVLFINDFSIPKEILESIGKEKIRTDIRSFKSKANDALIRDAKNLGIKTQELKNIFEKSLESRPIDLLSKNPSLVSLFIISREINENVGSLEKLKKIKKVTPEITQMIESLSLIEDKNLISKEYKILYKDYTDAITKFVDEIHSIKQKKVPNQYLINKLLFNNRMIPSIIVDNQLLVSFGRKL